MSIAAPSLTASSPLGHYADATGRIRELVIYPAAGDTVLVVDRDAQTRRQPLLVAHLDADEPVHNARVVSRLYLADPGRGRCRAVFDGDLHSTHAGAVASVTEPPCETLDWPVGQRGAYAIELVSGGASIPELRWVARGGCQHATTLTLREVIGRTEGYEPARSLTRQALAQNAHSSNVSTTVLRGELQRVNSSRIVLNRGLREAVLAAIDAGVVSASEIAIRCGRMRRDARGNVTGETTWLARRIGLVPEAGGATPTPWVHSEVLATVARCGLGISPHEVELG